MKRSSNRILSNRIQPSKKHNKKINGWSSTKGCSASWRKTKDPVKHNYWGWKCILIWRKKTYGTYADHWRNIYIGSNHRSYLISLNSWLWINIVWVYVWIKPQRTLRWFEFILFDKKWRWFQRLSIKEKHPMLPGFLKHEPNFSSCVSFLNHSIALLKQCGNTFCNFGWSPFCIYSTNMCLMTKRGPFFGIRLLTLSAMLLAVSPKIGGRRCGESFESLVNKMHDMVKKWLNYTCRGTTR